MATKIRQKQANQKSFFTRLKTFIWKVIRCFFILSIGSTVVFKFVPIPFTLTMVGQKIQQLGDESDAKFSYKWRSMNDISREAALSVVASEDQLFPHHFGFDVASIQENLQRNKTSKKLRGGSTISQQVARNVFLWQKRSWFRKGVEAYFTLLIELIWGKERILEVYLNVAETGKYTFGFEAAAQKYFGKSAADLNRQQAARITSILPSPRKWSADNPGPYVSKRSRQITRQMRALGGVSYIANLRKF